MTGRKRRYRNNRPMNKKIGSSRNRSSDQEERRTNRIRLIETIVEAVKLAWEIGSRL